MKRKIRNWYLKSYSADNLAKEIKKEVTYEGLYKTLKSKGDVYEFLGVEDSLIRENCFAELANILKKDYSYVYDLWLNGFREEKELIWICVYRDTIERHDDNDNLTELLVTKDFARQYYNECKKEDSVYADADDFLDDYCADDTEDFYEYAKKHNAILDRGDWGKILTKNQKETIIREVSLLKERDEGVGIDLNDEKGLFIQVVDYGEGKEYLIELNDIDEDRTYEPCASYNASSEFGNMEKLIFNIENYLKEEL